jgi:ureidoglycolate lyase
MNPLANPPDTTIPETTIDVPLVEASPDALADYGVMIGAEVNQPGLTIPFYAGAVEEGQNLDFHYRGQAVVRTARIHHRDPDITWLERHLHMSQIFVGLGSAPFAMVLGKPNHAHGARVPDLDTVAAFRIPPGHGVMIHRGTWHDFPMAFDEPVVVLTMNSAEVVEALASQREPADMDRGDVYKIDIARHTGRRLRVPF